VGKPLKWIIVVVVLAVGSNVLREAMKADKEVDARIALKASCARQAGTGGGVPEARVEAVCDCATERTATALGPDNVVRLATVSNATDSDKAALLTALTQCIQAHVPGR
jgi:hypothetical protein